MQQTTLSPHRVLYHYFRNGLQWTNYPLPRLEKDTTHASLDLVPTELRFPSFEEPFNRQNLGHEASRQMNHAHWINRPVQATGNFPSNQIGANLPRRSPLHLDMKEDRGPQQVDSHSKGQAKRSKEVGQLMSNQEWAMSPSNDAWFRNHRKFYQNEGDPSQHDPHNFRDHLSPLQSDVTREYNFLPLVGENSRGHRHQSKAVFSLKLRPTRPR